RQLHLDHSGKLLHDLVNDAFGHCFDQPRRLRHLLLHDPVQRFVVDGTFKIVALRSLREVCFHRYVNLKIVSGVAFMGVHTVIGMEGEALQGYSTCHSIVSKNDFAGFAGGLSASTGAGAGGDSGSVGVSVGPSGDSTRAARTYSPFG